MKDVIKTTFYYNLQRVRDLTQLHLALQSIPGQNSILYSEDVLRAAVVFMHASLEDLLRGIFKWKIPDRGIDQWNKIPLKGHSNRNQPKPFGLGSLFEYRTLTVDEIFRQSIEEYLNYTNYNKVEDIVLLFSEVGILKDSFEVFFPQLQEMMDRRHQIVHRADREVVLNSPDTELKSIEYTKVISYIENLDHFGETVFAVV